MRIFIAAIILLYLDTSRFLFCFYFHVNGQTWKARSGKSEAVGMNRSSGYIFSLLAYEFWVDEAQRSWEARGI